MNTKQKIAGWIGMACVVFGGIMGLGGDAKAMLMLWLVVVVTYSGLFFLLKDYKSRDTNKP